MLLCTIIIDFDKKVNEGLRKSRCFLQEKHLLLPIYVRRFRGDGKSLQKKRNLGIMVERDRGGIGYEKGLVEERVV
jgi:hypothetical protein